jgi:2-polyprenyl-3-methyl-5-hydroxy-6-metoxy-1,4-benzoquinol methylase
LAIGPGPSDHGRVKGRRYTLKADPHSSHSVILGWLAAGRGRRLLDVGAADGLLSRRLTTQGWKVTAIEADPVLAEAGAAHCERLVVADLDRGVPPLDADFDVVVCGDVLEHLADPARVLAGLVALLAPGGHVVVSVPNVAHLWIRLSLLAGRFDYADRGILDRTHLRFFTRRTLDALVAGAGLHVVRRAATPVPLHLAVSPRWHGRTLAAAHALSAAATRLAPRLLGYQFVVMARRGT